jgi:hypothetical protein
VICTDVEYSKPASLDKLKPVRNDAAAGEMPMSPVILESGTVEMAAFARIT